MINSEVELINKRLAERYGTILTGQPHFRLIWSEDVFEVRVGRFNEFFGAIFVRQYQGAKRVRKYNYIRNRWILEMHRFTKPPDEIADYDFYEPVYVFESKDGVPLEPRYWACELVCHAIINPNMDHAQIAQFNEDKLMKTEQDEVNYFYDLFDISKQQSQFMAGEAVLIHKGDTQIQ